MRSSGDLLDQPYEAPIGRDPKDRKRMAVVSDGRAATTGYRVRERFAGWTLLELDLVTGETLSGVLAFVARPGRSRVSDLLNSTSDRFVRLLSPGVERHVRRGAILRVRS